MIIRQSHIVPSQVIDIRLSDYARSIFTDIPSRKGIKKVIKRGEILIDNKTGKTGDWIQPGQTIQWIDLELRPPKSFKLKLSITFEDDYLAVVHKPAGFPVSGNQFRTIENALLFNLQPSSAKDALKWPRPVHRLDTPTSGLLLIAKTSSAQVQFSRQFENKTIQKKYQAIVMGRIAQRGMIRLSIDNKESQTDFEKIQTNRAFRFGQLSLVNLFPKTGRTHQLRKHLSSIGHPILGDRLYNNSERQLKGKGLFLCAVEIGFQHPIESTFITRTIATPHKFNYILEREERRYNYLN